MPATAETVSLGLPVAIDRIDRELKKLWSEGEGAMTRASLMNLAVYSEERESLTRNTRLLARITENHACRAIVIGADPHARNDRMEAWISADDDCPTSVVFGDSRQHLRVTGQRIWFFAVDREIHQRRSRHRPFAFAPKFF